MLAFRLPGSTLRIQWLRLSRAGFEMMLRAVLGAALMWALMFVGPVAAFQETGKGMAPAAKSAEGAPAAAQSAPSGLDMSGARAPKSGASEGTEVRIPGLGRLGVLPKMDFGLELLYGQSTSPATEPSARPQEVPLDDLTIRGSVKHNF